MKVALVQCPIWSRKSPPFAVALLTACLRNRGHQVSVFDINNYLYHKVSRKYRKMWREDCPTLWQDRDFLFQFISDNEKLINSEVEKILEEDPKIIGFSIYESSLLVSIEVAKKIKQKDKDKIIIFGGPQCARWVSAYSIIREREVDAVAIGEGDITLPEFIDTAEKYGRVDFCQGVILKKDNGIIDCGDRPIIKDLDSLPFPDFSDFSLDLYEDPGRLEIFTSRGCINQCVFCSERQFWIRYRTMAGRRIFQEIQYQLKKFKKANFFWFNDSLLNGNIRELSEFCDLVLKNRLFGISWSGQAIIRREMNSELLNKMKLAGCEHLNYGIETGSQQVLDKMKKYFTITTAEKVIRDTYKAGIKVSANFMFGLPGETEDDFQQTLRFLKRNRPYLTSVSPSLSFCVIVGISKLYQNSEEFGIKPNPHHLFWESVDGKNTYLERLRRYETFCKLACALGLTGVCISAFKTDREKLLDRYYAYKKEANRQL